MPATSSSSSSSASSPLRTAARAAGLVVVAAVATMSLAVPASAAAGSSGESTNAAQKAADFRHYGGIYPDQAAADAAGALYILSGSAAQFVIEVIWDNGKRLFELWYW
ncbi:hypothetical protein [Streptomyces griseus]|uniref:hypothetical protein n=1 Tax=Streptomyces griseus TaxID=1911 RepID=UPI0036F4DE50